MALGVGGPQVTPTYQQALIKTCRLAPNSFSLIIKSRAEKMKQNRKNKQTNTGKTDEAKRLFIERIKTTDKTLARLSKKIS